MAAPAAEAAAALLDGYLSMPTPFLIKTYQLVDDPSLDDVVSWNDDGTAFVVWQTAEFARDVLPKYFKHSNFSSFVRQLNTYGFRKVVGDRWEFANEFFRRGQKRLLCDIQRKKIASSSASSPPPNGGGALSGCCGENQTVPVATLWSGSWSGTTKMAEENERLRRENVKLARELAQMRGLCERILHLVSKYASSEGQGGDPTDTSGVGGTVLSSSPPLEMIPLSLSLPAEAGTVTVKGRGATTTGCGQESTKLFGVSIGPKRNRGEERGGDWSSTSESESEL